jgi:hypothetical protein
MAATLQYNNPLAAWPDSTGFAQFFGSTGSGVIGGNNQIAQFPTALHGAASNVAVMQTQYGNSTVGTMLSKWTGGNPYAVPGIDVNAKVSDVLADPVQGPMLLNGMARNEAGAAATLPLGAGDWATAIAQGSAAAKDGVTPGTVSTIGTTAVAAGASVFSWVGHQIVRAGVVMLGFIFVGAGLGMFALTAVGGVPGAVDVYEGSLRRRMYKGAANVVDTPEAVVPKAPAPRPSVPMVDKRGIGLNTKPWGDVAPAAPKVEKVRTKPGRPRNLNPKGKAAKAATKPRAKGATAAAARAKAVDVDFTEVIKP